MTTSSDEVRGCSLPVLKGEHELALAGLPQLPLPSVTPDPGSGSELPPLGEVPALSLCPPPAQRLGEGADPGAQV